jgi:hypothetical protein
MKPRSEDENILVGVDAESLSRDCRLLRELREAQLPSADEVLDFIDGYNSFINHRTRPFMPLREGCMLL